MAAVRAGESEDTHVSRTGGFEGGGAGVERGAGGHHIVDQHQAAAGDAAGMGHVEGGTNICAALTAGQSGLSPGRARTPNEPFDGQSRAGAQDAGQRQALVETAVHAAAPMKRHGHKDIEALVPRESAATSSVQRPVECADAVILEEMNEVAQGAFVGAEGVGCIEAVGADAAGETDAVIVERVPVAGRGRGSGHSRLRPRKWMAAQDIRGRRGCGRIRGGWRRRRGIHQAGEARAGWIRLR